jgi:hypothetical protein
MADEFSGTQEGGLGVNEGTREDSVSGRMEAVGKVRRECEETWWYASRRGWVVNYEMRKILCSQSREGPRCTLCTLLSKADGFVCG